MGFPAIAEMLLPAVLAALMAAAAITDVRRYIIPNWTCLAVAGAWALLMLAEFSLGDAARLYPDPWRQIWSAILVAGLVFAGAAGLFAAGVMGGGDVKLLGAIALWAGPQLAMLFLFVTSLIGGIVSLVILWREKTRAKATTSPIVNTLTSTMTQPKVPYGLGIAAGGFYVAWALATRTGLIG